VRRAAGALVYGKPADRFGLGPLAAFGVATFAAGSIFGFFAGNFATLIAARIAQGIGASAIPSLTMLIPVRFVREERRGRALGAVAAVLAASGAAGPIAGGMIAGSFHWRALFLFSAGALALLPFFLKWMPEEPERGRRIIFLPTGHTGTMRRFRAASGWVRIPSMERGAREKCQFCYSGRFDLTPVWS